jgi:E3 ubiquitin-protein ligase MYLIP
MSAFRRLYFLHLRKDFTDGKIVTPQDKTARLYALIAQASTGDHSESHSPCNYCKNSDGECRKNWTSDVVATEHDKLRGANQSTAEYRFLKELADLENYGTEFHIARNSLGNHLNIGVSSEELRIYDAEFNFVER